MRLRRIARTLLLSPSLVALMALAALVVAPGVAHATATLVSPINGARAAVPVTRFSWTLDAGHRPDQLRASRDRTLDGGGLLLNEVETLSFDAAETSGELTGLDAGPWFWQVRSYDANLENEHTTPLGDFIVPFHLAFSTSEGYDRLSVARRSGFVVVEIPSQANGTVRIRTLLTVRRGRTVVGRLAATNPVEHWVDVNAVYMRWHRPSTIPRGTRLTATATISANGVQRSMSRTFLAP